MALPIATQDREYRNFSDNGDGTTSRFVKIIGSLSGGGSGGLLDGVIFDAVVGSYPNSVTEIYSLKSGGLSGTLTATITVVYTNTSKKLISTVEKT
jgi:hypothetical protein